MEEENLLSLIKGVDVEKVGSVLKELEKYEKVLDKISGIVVRLNRIGVLPAVLRIIGQKSGIENIDKPLPQMNPLSVDAASSTHLLMIKEINKQSEENVSEMFKQAILIEDKANKKLVGKNGK